jgi:hypothetical protein
MKSDRFTGAQIMAALRQPSTGYWSDRLPRIMKSQCPDRSDFGDLGSCFRYRPRLAKENDRITDFLERLK